MENLYMLVGMPASGKSTIAERLKSEGAKVHSSDAIRSELLGDIESQADNELVFKTLHHRVKKDLERGYNVVFDACNINYKKRMIFLNSIKYIKCNKIAVLLATPYERCLELNSKRDRRVPEQSILRMYKNFTIPQLYEGFDEIQIVWNFDDTKYDAFNLFKRLDVLDQDSPYHTLTVGEHCFKTFGEVCKVINSGYILATTALLHDIGKEFTKEFNEVKGHSTFYQHHLVGAYLSLFYLKASGDYDDEDILEVSKYIHWHMQPYFIKTEKSIVKFKKLVGEDTYNKILILHEADKKAK